MYQLDSLSLWSSLEQNGYRSVRIPLYSNGIHMRARDGRLLFTKSFKNAGICFYSEDCGHRFIGIIKDKILIERLYTYWDKYFGVQYTNCSSLAHYLTTGEFVECKEKERFLVIQQGMRPYEMASRVDVGDMICLIYTRKKLKSRKIGLAPKYRKVEKYRCDIGGFAGTKGLMQQKVFAPDEIRDLVNDFCCADFHFMVCVAKENGNPVWLSQLGFEKGTGEDVGFVLTVGERDPYLLNIPLFTLIKKRR